MPRQGDGSSDNGPIEAGENLIHGASGDVSTALFRFLCCEDKAVEVVACVRSTSTLRSAELAGGCWRRRARENEEEDEQGKGETTSEACLRPTSGPPSGLARLLLPQSRLGTQDQA